MGFQITNRARIASEQLAKEPSMVLSIEGAPTKFGNVKIVKAIRIGDPDLYIGDDWVIGGFRELVDQLTAISFQQGTTTSIKQQLDVDKGRGSSISSMEVALLDINQELTRLISPGVVVADLLGRRAKIQLGFGGNTTSYPEDYITIFRGIIDDISAGQGLVKLNLAHPDQKKRSQLFTSHETDLDGAITNSQTTITVDNAADFLVRVQGPDLSYDPSFKSYVLIDEELIEFTGVSGNQLTGCVRGQLGTVAASHDDGASVKSFYRLMGNAIDLALKIMLSRQGYFYESVTPTNFNKLGDGSSVSNAIYFTGIDVVEEYGLVIGSYVTSSGSSFGANNVTLKEIIDVQQTEEGSYIVIDGVSFVEEIGTPAQLSFRSQYDTLPSGLEMGEDEVDILEHLRIQQTFLSSFEMDHYLKESIDNGKEWIEQEIYKCVGAYSLPRKARSSLGYFVAPIPGIDTKELSENNITNPERLKLRRSINKNFANTIVVKYDLDALEDKFLRGFVNQSSSSKNQIKIPNRGLVIEAPGLRQSLFGQQLSQIISDRRLDRFKFGAEFLESIEVQYGPGYTIEVGDIMILNSDNLNIANTADGTRNKPPKLFEVANIEKNFKTGKIVLDLIDTGFDGSKRYCLIGPSSRVKSAASQTQFTIEQYFTSRFGVNEGAKWSRFKDVAVKVRSYDFITRYAETVITDISGNLITVRDSLGFTPQAGDTMELAQYDFADTTEQIKLLYGFMTDLATFADGKPQYNMV